MSESAGDMAEGVKIVGLCVLAAVSYGVVHDQITARVCLEYFTIGHADVAGHDPTFVGLYWGVVATWWVGLPLGIALAIAARIGGGRRPATARELAPRVAALMVSLLALAMIAGLVGYADAAATSAPTGWLVERVPAEARLGFVFDASAHGASYVGGFLGGLAVSVSTFFRRPRIASDARPRPPYENLLVGIGCTSGIVAPLLLVYALLLANQIFYFDVGDSITELGPVGYLVWHSTPWMQYAMALAGVVALVRVVFRWARDVSRGERGD